LLKHRSVAGTVDPGSRTWASRTWTRRKARLGGEALRGVACPGTGSWTRSVGGALPRCGACPVTRAWAGSIACGR
jgi:hypothetical protein